MPDGWLALPGGLAVLGFVVAVRWLALVQRRVNDHAERIARLEGWRDAPTDRRDDVP